MFNLEDIPLQEYAEALGLPTVPHVKFIPGNQLKQAKNAPHIPTEAPRESKSGKSKYDKMSERRNQTVLTQHYGELRAEGNVAFKLDEPDDSGEIFTKKRKVDWEKTDIPTGQRPVSLPSFVIEFLVIEAAT